MKNYYMLLSLPLFIFLAYLSAVHAEDPASPLDKALTQPLEKPKVVVTQDNIPHIIVINPGLSDAFLSFGEWEGVIDSKRIYEWGRSHKLYMNPDAGLIMDNLAGYLASGGSVTLTVDKLKIDGFYHMWIDFVTFRNPDGENIPSLLKVFVKNEKYPYRELDSISFSNAKAEVVKIDIPYELSQSGKIIIRFEEYTLPKAVFKFKPVWGIWDIIIADKDELSADDVRSQNVYEVKKIPYKSDLVK